MATVDSSAAALDALVEAAHRRLKAQAAQADGKRGSSGGGAAARAKSAGHGPIHAEERLRRRRERDTSSATLRGVAANGQPALLKERKKEARNAKEPSAASVHSASTDSRQSAVEIRQSAAHGERSQAQSHGNFPWRWFESASAPLDRDASRVGATSSVMSGRRYAGYATHRPLRPRSADPVLRSATETSTSFVDMSHRRDVLQAPETVYTRERRRNTLVHSIGGDPRRAATAASFDAKYGVTEHQNEMHWRSSDDMAIAIGTSPDIETAQRDKEEAYRRVTERQLRDLSLMAVARDAALNERRAQSARASMRGWSQLSPRLVPVSERLHRAETQRSSDPQSAQDLQVARQLRRQSSLPISGESSTNSRPIADQASGSSRLQRSRSLAEQLQAAADVDAYGDSGVDVASLKSCETWKSEAAQNYNAEATASLAQSRTFEPMSTTEWTSLAERCKKPVYQRSLSKCSTAASSYCSSVASESSRRSARAGLLKSQLARPKSAGALTSAADARSQGDAVTLAADDDYASDAMEDAILRIVDELSHRFRHARKSGERSAPSCGSAASVASTRRRPSSAVGRLQTVSERTPSTKSKGDHTIPEPQKSSSLNFIDELVRKASNQQKRQSSGSSIGVATSKASTRARPSSAAARLQSNTSEKTATTKTQASCGAAHQAVRAARQRPSSAGAPNRFCKT